MPEKYLAVVLGEIAREAAGRAESADVHAAVVRTLLDWFAVTVGGSTTPAAHSLIQGIGSTSGHVRLAGTSGRFASVETGALIHGTAAHALELDDIYAPGLYHPSAPTVAAALAVAERFGATGTQLVRGIVAGIEVGCRVAADLGPEHYRYWHTTGTVGAIGAAAAASVVMGATLKQLAHSIGIAGTMGGGLQQTFRRDGGAKPLHSGHAAQSGVIAAITAFRGLTGALDVLEGPAGLAVATGVETSWEACRAPVEGPLCIERLTVKPYPCCGHTFAAIDAALELRRQNVRAEDVVALRVETYSTAISAAGIAKPQKPSEARFSIPYAAAIGLLDGAVTSSSFAQERMCDPAVVALLTRTTLHPHSDFDEAFPHRRGARVIIERRSGDSVTAEARDRLGSPENPIGDEALRQKFNDLVVPILGKDQTGRLSEAIGGIGAHTSLRDLPWSTAKGTAARSGN